MRKPDFGLCKNKGADQLRSNCEADQHLCFCCTDTTIPPLLIHKLLRSENVKDCWCQTWSEMRKTGFLVSWLIYAMIIFMLPGLKI